MCNAFWSLMYPYRRPSTEALIGISSLKRKMIESKAAWPKFKAKRSTPPPVPAEVLADFEASQSDRSLADRDAIKLRMQQDCVHVRGAGIHIGVRNCGALEAGGSRTAGPLPQLRFLRPKAAVAEPRALFHD